MTEQKKTIKELAEYRQEVLDELAKVNQEIKDRAGEVDEEPPVQHGAEVQDQEPQDTPRQTRKK